MTFLIHNLNVLIWETGSSKESFYMNEKFRENSLETQSNKKSSKAVKEF